MKKCIVIILSLTLLVWVFPILVNAEETLKAPTVQHKLINHDQIALRWSKVDGADYYYVYRTDVDTGKTVRYKKSVEGTTIKISGLKAETDYIFKVAAVSEKYGQITIGKKSKGTKVTTPKEWYYFGSYSVNYDKEILKSNYYKRNYSKTAKEEINLGDIKFVDEIAYFNGWYYFIANYQAVIDDDTYPWVWESDSAISKCIGRIKEDGTCKEILFDSFADAEGWSYRYNIDQDYIYLYRKYYDEYYSEFEGCISDFHKISLITGEITKVIDVFYSSEFDVQDNYIYYIYNEYEYDDDIENYPLINSKYIDTYLCRIKNNGTEKKIICKMSDISGTKIYVDNDDVYCYGRGSVYKISLDDGKTSLLYSEPSNYICDFEIVNGYIYFTEYDDEIDIQYDRDPIGYCRIKNNGTGLTKSDKPFEWKY